MKLKLPHLSNPHKLKKTGNHGSGNIIRSKNLCRHIRLSVPSSMEQEAFNEAMANIGSGLGTSISFAQSAGQQVAMDVTRGLLQGTSGYLAKKFRTVKVHLKAGYKVMLYAKQN